MFSVPSNLAHVRDQPRPASDYFNVTGGDPALAAVGEDNVGEAANFVQDADAGAFVEDEEVLSNIRN